MWWASLNEQFIARDQLSHHINADVCIIGAGFTGLWTALALLEAEPDMQVVILEAEAAGYGASGRNGGWASALFPIEDAAIAKTYGHDVAVSLRRQLEAEIDRIIDFTKAEGISADIAKGGTITLARNEAQAKRLRESVEAAQALGVDQDLIWLDAEEASARAAGEGVLGGTFTPHCAAIQPANLVRGLADAVERRGGRIFEHSAVTEIQEANGDEPASVHCGRGSVSAKVVVRATEAWTATLPKLNREIVPIYSLVIATEPLADSVFKEIGLK
ncbi:MAG: FAD-dependent oxidoreductase, partial [Actinomycetes bacterium]